MGKSASEVRASFLEYFRGHGHEVVGSGPLVPAKDPTLYFANAGMVQFKDVFTGKEKRPYSRACSSQKCVRVSGKHNDLENVGVTARHNTFFEMLGNFSFGDYFKQGAIEYGWEWLTGVLGIPADKLVVTVFGGEGDLPPDEEAEEIWREVSGLPGERILRCGAKENFWQMGETGPCGPCSEIHYYFGDGVDLESFGEEPGLEGRGWVELWNLVFMQFERFEGGRMEPLPAPSIDTGAGLERVTAVCQGVFSSYDTDLLRPIVDLASEISGKKYACTMEPDDVSMRVIADHARMTAFLIAEGVFPDRAERAYVLRRVMRRAVRHAHRLGISRVCLPECALKVVEVMGEAYPELVERRALIEEIAGQEEERFRATLKRGLERLEGYDWGEVEKGSRVLPGSVAFELCDTYGFPPDLQEVIGSEQGFRVDHEGFDCEMARARERSAGSKVGECAVSGVHREICERVKNTEFVGCAREKERSRIVALVRDGVEVERLEKGEAGEVVVERTPFYPEQGGQVGDQGRIAARGKVFAVEGTVKPAGEMVVHCGRMMRGALARGDEVRLEVSNELRSATRRNHSATHLLHRALRSVVGEHAMQKGSLVGPDRLRFDYSGARPLTADEIERIEAMVNADVLRNVPVKTEVLPIDEAKKRGAIGIFEEKYGDVVRMVKMGESMELCGGTHAKRTGDIGAFKILAESGIAAGVRRVEAATGLNAWRYLRELEKELVATAALVKGEAFQTREKVERLLQQQKELGREVERLNRKLVSGGAGDVSAKARKVGEVSVLGATVDVGGLNAMREMADRLRDKMAPAVVVLGSVTEDGKAMLVCTVSKELNARLQAGKLIREVAGVVGGGGGGRPDFAQAGGPDGGKLDEAVESIYGLVEAAG